MEPDSEDSTHDPVIANSCASPASTANDATPASMKGNNDVAEEYTSNKDGAGQEEGTSNAKTSDAGGSDSDDASKRPTLPIRPSATQNENDERPRSARGALSPSALRPTLLSKPTTALSSLDIQTLSFPDGSRGTYATSEGRSPSVKLSIPELRSKTSRTGSEGDDVGSLMSYQPTLRASGDLESLLGEAITAQSPAWRMLSTHAEDAEPGQHGETTDPFDKVKVIPDDNLSNFSVEFDEMEEVDSKGGNEEELLSQWKSKLKHYLILSSAGKPIWSRHGDQNLINGYIGIIQTIISFYEGSKDPLKGFTARDTRFVISTQGPLYFVAISRLGESDAQLRAQLDALYMQILSTLTLPTLTHIFQYRPSSDLRRPLDGTESLLSSLADTFTKGSPSALLSALECLKIRKSHRTVINNTLLKLRSDKLLYGLIVAGGRLVSVIRPKRHSLHPSDLQLIFNMLFEAGSIKAGGGENWIPLCLPGFNNRGYLYMYVSFLSVDDDSPTDRPQTAKSGSGRHDEIAVLLISAEKESFYELKQMRDDVVEQMEKNGSMDIIKKAVRQGRPSTTDIVPGTQLQHFLYKSRANVQFSMPSFGPHYNTLIARRRLMTLYHKLHASVHTKHSHLKILHCTGRDSISLAWTTPMFELYCVAGANASRAALAQGANRIVQWVKREEERVFIIGGAVF